MGQSYQFTLAPNGNIAASNKKTGATGFANSAPQQNQQAPSQGDAPTYQGTDLSTQDMQRLQHAAQLGNQDAVAAFAYLEWINQFLGR